MTGGPLPEITPLNASYWAGTAVGELRLRRCNACGTLDRFVSDWCRACWSADLSETVASGRGVVRSYTVVHMAPYPSFADRVPYVIALIELAEGPVMMANIVGCDTAAVSVGMPVSVRFEQRGDVAIPQFAPASADAR